MAEIWLEIAVKRQFVSVLFSPLPLIPITKCQQQLLFHFRKSLILLHFRLAQIGGLSSACCRKGQRCVSSEKIAQLSCWAQPCTTIQWNPTSYRSISIKLMLFRLLGLCWTTSTNIMHIHYLPKIKFFVYLAFWLMKVRSFKY